MTQTPPTATDPVAAERPASTRRRRGRVRGFLIRLLAVLLAILLTLGVVEIVFRVLGYEPIYDVYSSPEAFLRRDELLGWSMHPGAEGEFVGPRPFPITFRSRVRVNSLGLRGGEVQPLPADGLRVLVLGDSWTAGFEVEEDETYSAVLSELLTERLGVEVQVINAGVRGYGTDQSLLWYRERLADLEPDLVIHHTTGNDPDDNVVLHRIRRVFAKPAFAMAGDGALTVVGRPVPDYPQCSEYRVVDGRPARVDGFRARSFCSLQTNLADHSAFFSFVTQRLQSNPALVEALYGLGSATDEGASSPSPADGGAAPSGPAELPPPFRLTSALIEELAREAGSRGAEFALAGVSWDLDRLDIEAFERGNIPVLRIEPAIEDEEATLIPNDGHPNALGHRRIAELLADEVEALLEPLVR